MAGPPDMPPLVPVPHAGFASPVDVEVATTYADLCQASLGGDRATYVRAIEQHQIAVNRLHAFVTDPL